jgi:hypothetical protein
MNLSLENSADGGTHWISCFIDPIGSKSVEYYDSFARPPPASLMKDLKQIVNKINASSFLKFKQNMVVHQSVKTSNCGWFAMAFLIKRLEGESFSQATGFDDHMKHHQVVQHEAEIERMKRLPQFKFI